MIRSTASEHPIHGDELGVSSGDGSPLNTSSSLQSLISELKCRILFGRPSPRGLRQRGFQPAVPLSDLATFSLTGAAVVSNLSPVP